MKHLILILTLTSAVTAEQPNETVKELISEQFTFARPEQFKFTVIEGRFAVYSGSSNPIQLNPKLRKNLPKTYEEALKKFGPAFINSDSGTGTWQWTFTDHRTLSCSFPQKLSDKLVNMELNHQVEPTKM